MKGHGLYSDGKDSKKINQRSVEHRKGVLEPCNVSLANMGSKTQKRSMGERIRGAVGGVSMKKNSKSSDRNIEPVARTFSTLGHEPQLSSYIVKTVFNQSQVRRC